MKWIIGFAFIGGLIWWGVRQSAVDVQKALSVFPSPVEKKPDPVDPLSRNTGDMDPIPDPVPLPKVPSGPSGPTDVPRGVEDDDGPVTSPIILIN